MGTELIDDALAPIESMMMSIPYADTPLGRAAIFGGAGVAFAYGVKPSMSFRADGSAKPWVFFEPNNPDTTMFPYWAYGVVPAVLFGILI